MLAYATLEKPVGQLDSCAKARRESPGPDDAKRRMLRGANLAPSSISRIRCRSRRARRDGRGTLPKSCNLLQSAAILLVEWIERPHD